MQLIFWVIFTPILAVVVFYSVVAAAIRSEETEKTLFDPVLPVSLRGLVRVLVNVRVLNPLATVHGALRKRTADPVHLGQANSRLQTDTTPANRGNTGPRPEKSDRGRDTGTRSKKPGSAVPSHRIADSSPAKPRPFFRTAFPGVTTSAGRPPESR